MTARKSLSPMARLKVFETTGGVCHICSQRIQVGEKWEVEHVIPLALGGEDGGTNLKPAHVDCHKGKSKSDAARKAKADRMRVNHLGARKPSTFPGSRDSKFKKRMDGSVVLR